MEILHLSIITAIGIGIIASFGITIMLDPQMIGLHTNPQTTLGKTFAGIAVNPNTNRVYVSDYGGKNVFVLDGHTNQTLDVIPINGNPWDVAVNPVTNKVYVVNRDSENAVTIIDGSTDQIIKSVDVTEMGTKPPQMAYDAMRVNPAYYKIEPMQVAVNPITNRIYVSDWNYADGGVTVIDGTSDKVIDTILGLGGASYGIAVNENTNRIYVDNFQPSWNDPYNISVIDGRTDKILDNVTIGLGKGGVSTIPNGLRVAPLTLDPTTNMVYAYYRKSATIDNDRSTDTIAIINGTTNMVVDKIPIYASGLAIDPHSNTLYVAMAMDSVGRIGSFDVAIINEKNNKITGYLKSDNVVFDLAVNSHSGNVYVTCNYPKNSVSFFGFEL